jgi:hypothetical protein
MGRHEKIAVAAKPPEALAPAMREQRAALERELAAFRQEAAERTLDGGNRGRLAGLELSIRSLEFQIDCSALALDLAEQKDREAVAAWTAQVQASKPAAPPAPIAKSVLAHRKKLEAERDGLRTGAALLALKSSQGDTAAKAELVAIPGRYAALTFEIDLNHEAHQLATEQDSAAETAWRAGLQAMDPDDLIEGIGKDSCCTLCSRGTPGGCVFSAGDSYRADCMHPVKELAGFHCDDTGRKIFPGLDNPIARRIFEAASKRMKLRRGGIGEFV